MGITARRTSLRKRTVKLSLRRENPFLNRNKITDPQEFYGRQDVIDDILERILHSEPQSVAIVGERRIGKSSLLTHLHDQLTHGHMGGDVDKRVAIRIDPEELVIREPKGFTWVLIDELVSAEPDLARFVKECIPVGSLESVPFRRPEIILNNLLKGACGEGYRFVFFIDEFELLAQNEELSKVKYLHYLRGISDNYALAYVTASRRTLSDISHDVDPEGSPFDNNFSPTVEIGLLCEDDCQALMDGQLREAEQRADYFTDTDRCEAEAIAGKHPYFLKIACSHLFNWVAAGRPADKPWQDLFRDEAEEEFDRMWRALDMTEHNWLLRAQVPDDLPIETAQICKVLEKLVDRGLLEKVENSDGEGEHYGLFSKGLSEYISQRVEALQADCEEIERCILEGNLRWEPKALRTRVEHLKVMKDELDNRGETADAFGNTYEKCKGLITILAGTQRLVEGMEHFELGGQGPGVSAAMSRDEVDRALDSVLATLCKKDCYSWEANDHKLNVRTGKALLDQMVVYMSGHRRDRVFGNGFDRLLAARIQFMRQYGTDQFKDFSQQFDGAFGRLLKVCDYARARKILEPDFGKFFRWLAEIFDRSPEWLVFGMFVLLPFGFCGFVQNALTPFFGEATPAVALGVIAVFHIPLIYQVTYSALWREQSWLTNAPRHYRSLLFPRGFGPVMVHYAVSLFLASGSYRELIGRPALALGIAVGLIVLAFIVLTACLKMTFKLAGFAIPLRRASYSCSLQFLEALWVAMAGSLLLSMIFQDMPPASHFGQSMVGIFPLTIGFSNFAISVPMVLLFSSVVVLMSILSSSAKAFESRRDSW